MQMKRKEKGEEKKKKERDRERERERDCCVLVWTKGGDNVLFFSCGQTQPKPPLF